MLEWVDSPEGQLWMDMSDTLEVPLKHVGLDVRQRKFLWPDAKRLDLDQACLSKSLTIVPILRTSC